MNAIGPGWLVPISRSSLASRRLAQGREVVQEWWQAGQTGPPCHVGVKKNIINLCTAKIGFDLPGYHGN